MSITQKERRFPSATGLCDIVYRQWIPEEIRGAVQLTHGMAEHIDRYQEFAAFLAQNGFLVYGHDQAGHGKSIPKGGVPGFFREEDGWTALIEDMRRILLQVREGNPAIPFVLFGLAHYARLAFLRPEKVGRPEKILLHDRPTQLCLALYLATCAAIWLSR